MTAAVFLPHNICAYYQPATVGNIRTSDAKTGWANTFPRHVTRMKVVQLIIFIHVVFFLPSVTKYFKAST